MLLTKWNVVGATGNIILSQLFNLENAGLQKFLLVFPYYPLPITNPHKPISI